MFVLLIHQEAFEVASSFNSYSIAHPTPHTGVNETQKEKHTEEVYQQRTK